MNLRTFGQLKAQIARVCGASGMAVTDPRVMMYVNLATEELLNEADFPWTVDRVIFKVYDGRIVLPSDFDRMYGLNVDGVPQQMVSPWFEVSVGAGGSGEEWYGHGGWGGANWETNAGLTLDRDMVFQFRDIPRNQEYYLTVQTQYPEDADAVILIKGYDHERNPVNVLSDGTAEGGELFDLTLAPQRSASTFSQISGYVKPVTKGEVWINAVGLNGDTYHVATLAPKDESPFWRSYKVVGASFGGCGCVDSCGCQVNCVMARCRRRYVPVSSDNDFVMCGNIPALKKMVQAVWYGDADQYEKYLAYKAAAVDILKKEATAYRGKSRVPAITFTRGFGLGNIPSVR
jgi:hypothetical protein